METNPTATGYNDMIMKTGLGNIDRQYWFFL